GRARDPPRMRGAAAAHHAGGEVFCLGGAGAADREHAAFELQVAPHAAVMLIECLAVPKELIAAVAFVQEGRIAVAPHRLGIDAIALRDRAPGGAVAAQRERLGDLWRAKLAEGLRDRLRARRDRPLLHTAPHAAT